MPSEEPKEVGLRPTADEPWRAVGLLLCAMSVAALGHGGRSAPRRPASPTKRSAAPSAATVRAAATLRDGRPLDVNTASAEALRLLPGIGSALAERIVEERRRGGPYRDPADLQRVRGIGPRKAQRLARWLRFGGAPNPSVKRAAGQGGPAATSAETPSARASGPQSRLRRKAPRP